MKGRIDDRGKYLTWEVPDMKDVGVSTEFRRRT